MSGRRVSTARGDRDALLGAIVLIAGLVTSAASAAPPFAVAGAAGAPPPIVAGMALGDALRALAARGLPIVFSTLVVPAGLVVEAAPTANEPRAQLDELLAAHGLVAIVGAGGSLVIQPAEPDTAAPATLVGTVRSLVSNAPLAGVHVALIDPRDGATAAPASDATTDAAGRFELAADAAGRVALEARHPGFVIERFESIDARPGETTALELRLQPAPFAGDEIVVHPSRATLLRAEPVAAVELAKDEIAALPHLGDDLLRALELLPGVASNDLTAQFHVRGGRRDELLLLLDGQEIYDGFHLRDFDGALSFFAASSLAGVHLTTGAFPAESGDRMGGVLELTSSGTFDAGSYRIAATALTIELGAARPFAGGRGRWFVQARRGTSELVAELFDHDQPELSDLFARGDFELSETASVRLHLLHASDRYELEEGDLDESKHLRTAYDSSYLWLTHQLTLGNRAVVDTALSHAESERDRRDDERDGEKELAVVDLRATAVDGVRQQWCVQASARQLVKLGLGFRRFESEYDYAAERAFDTPLALLRAAPRDGLFRYSDRLVDDHLEAFVSDRISATDRLTVELGLRHDRISGARREAAWSPRLHLAWAPGERSVVRLGWGRYLQSHRTYELMVEDGDVARYPFERSEHWAAGFERLFARASGPGLDSVRIEAFHRPIERPRPRYESLLEPFDPFPEGELDRYRFAPERSRSTGVELFLRGHFAPGLDGWTSYAFQRVEDTIDGEAVPRSIDQRHTLNLDLVWRPAASWSVTFAWLAHSGRPTTALSIAAVPAVDGAPEEDDDGASEEPEEPAVVPLLGPLNGERLAAYHRLDLRIAKVAERSWGRLTLFADVQNLYARENQAGVDVEYDDESGDLVRTVESWPGFLASAGVVFEF